MSRWRAPAEKSSPYITAEGHARLKAEFDELWRLRRPQVVRALSAAAAEGDRSENAEYIYRKKELREIDARLKYLTLRLKEVRLVQQEPADMARIFFGAWVELADDEGHCSIYRIVGSDEADSSRGHISVDAPMARALLGRTQGETVTVVLPKGAASFEVLRVAYGPTLAGV